tara:strand:+ start:293 stop:739 length:447 start_codon:yes stop_codon:yes gene_type:complete
MNHQTMCEIKKARNVLITSNDPRFNYTFQPEEDIDKFNEIPDIITMNRYDYSFKRDDGEVENNFKKLPTLTPASMLSCANSLEDMEGWYAAKFPNLPEEYYGIMARYSLGQPLTKKQTKNELKKMNKKNKEPPVGMKVATGKFRLKFD